jgi:hypothetical protein
VATQLSSLAASGKSHGAIKTQFKNTSKKQIKKIQFTPIPEKNILTIQYGFRHRIYCNFAASKNTERYLNVCN